MSEKKNSLEEEKRILQKKLQWYTLEAEAEEFDVAEVEAILKRLDELEPLPEETERADFLQPEEALKRFYQKHTVKNVEN